LGLVVRLLHQSGVGGGIVAALPATFSVCVWSPGLDAQGNSLLGAVDRSSERGPAMNGSLGSAALVVTSGFPGLEIADHAEQI
jgi:hypothetical protein